MATLSASRQATCQRDGCSNVYQAKRSTKRYCSARCRALASNHTSPNKRNAVTSGNAKRRKSLTSGNETLTRYVPLADLVQHIEKHYTAFQLQNDLDCVLSLCASEADQETVINVARSKMERLNLRGVNARMKLPPQRKGMTKRHARQITEWNVARGKQGRYDLEAYV